MKIILTFILSAVLLSSVGSAMDSAEKPEKTKLDHYLAIQTALAADDLESAKSGAAELKMLIETEGAPADTPMLYKAASGLADSGSLEQARTQFFTLSKAVIQNIHSLNTSGHKNLALANCPMARNNQGASWIQEGSRVNNPYFGSMMLRCGTVEPIPGLE